MDAALQVARADQAVAVHATQLPGGEHGTTGSGHTIEPRQRSAQLVLKRRHFVPPAADDASIKRLSKARRFCFCVIRQ